MIKTVFFDIGNVLLTIDPDKVVTSIADATGVETAAVAAALSSESHDAYERGEISDEQFYSSVAAHISADGQMGKSQFFHCWRGMLGELTRTFAVAVELSKKCPVWVASNTNRHHIELGGVGSKMNSFAGAIYSFEVGARKPDESFFRAMLAMANTTASESLFVDDRMENVTAAEKYGMTAIHYLSHQQFIEDMKKLEIT